MDSGRWRGGGEDSGRRRNGAMEDRTVRDGGEGPVRRESKTDSKALRAMVGRNFVMVGQGAILFCFVF